MTPQEIALSLALLVVGLAGSAFCSGVETGIYSLSRIRLNLRASRGDDTLARLLKREVERPARVLANLLIANTFFANLGSIGISALLDRHFSEVGVVVMNVVILTPLLFVLSESVPKEVFRVEADRLTYYARAAPHGVAHAAHGDPGPPADRVAGSVHWATVETG